jgi:hypothetical protein
LRYPTFYQFFLVLGSKAGVEWMVLSAHFIAHVWAAHDSPSAESLLSRHTTPKDLHIQYIQALEESSALRTAPCKASPGGRHVAEKGIMKLGQ